MESYSCVIKTKKNRFRGLKERRDESRAFSPNLDSKNNFFPPFLGVFGLSFKPSRKLRSWTKNCSAQCFYINALPIGVEGLHPIIRGQAFISIWGEAVRGGLWARRRGWKIKESNRIHSFGRRLLYYLRQNWDRQLFVEPDSFTATYCLLLHYRPALYGKKIDEVSCTWKNCNRELISKTVSPCQNNFCLKCCSK